MSGAVGIVWTDRMLARGGRRIAAAMAVLVGVGVVPFLVLGRASQLWEAWIVHNALFGLLLAVVLWLIAPVEPRNAVVWIVALGSAMSGIQVLTGGAVVWLLDAAGIGGNPQELVPASLDPPVAVLQWLNAWTWVLIAVPLATFLPLLFPDGRLPSRRWRPVAGLAAAALGLVVAAMMAVAWPTSTVPVAEAMTEQRGAAAVARVGYPLLLLAVLASLTAPAVRARRADGVRRRQIRWVGFGAGMFALVTAGSFVLDPSAKLFAVAVVPGGMALIGSIAVATCATGCMRSTGSSVAPPRTRWSRLCSSACTRLWRWCPRCCWTSSPTSWWPGRPWRPPVRSCRCGDGCRRRSTAASTGPATTPAESSTSSPHSCATTCSSTGSGRGCWRSSMPWSCRRTRRCGCASRSRRHEPGKDPAGVGRWGVGPDSLAIGIAVTRYRLYEIDRIINRTVTYALVTAVVFAVYVTVVGLPGALFVPVRRRVHAAVDRRFNRARYDAQQVVERFGHRLRDDLDIEYLTADPCAVVAAAVQPTFCGTWRREDGAR